MGRRLKHGKVLSRGDVSKRLSNYRMDYVLLGLVLGLSAFGLLMVYDASVAVALSRYSDRYFFVKSQAQNLGIGLVLLLIISQIDYHVWRRFAAPLLVVGIVVLLAVFIPGIGVSQGGAKSWLDIGPITFQPSYPLIIVLIIYLSSWLTRDKNDIDSWRNGFAP